MGVSSSVPAKRGNMVVVSGCDHEGSVGHMLALRLASMGFTCVALCLTASGASSLAGKDGVHPVQCDVTSESDIDKVYDAYMKVETSVPGATLHAVVANHGVACLGAAEWFSLEDYKRTMDVNFHGSVALAYKFIPLLKRSEGRLLFSSSLTGFKACPMNAPYTASKWALEGFAETLRIELSPFNVSVCIMQLGPMITPMTADAPSAYKRSFSAAPASVRNEYGDEFLDPIISTFENGKDKLPRADEAVDGMVAALTAKKPYAVYRTGPVTKIFYYLVAYMLPVSWADGLYRKAFMAGSVPKACKALPAPGAATNQA